MVGVTTGIGVGMGNEGTGGATKVDGLSTGGA